MSRYDRQIGMVDGEEGQQKLLGARIGIVGCGGRGVHALTTFVESGIMEYVLCDSAVPQIEDLNRQFIYAAGDMRSKAVVSAEWVLALNYSALVEAHSESLTAETVRMFGGCSVVLDCTESEEVGRILCDWCRESGVPLISSSVSGYVGEIFVSIPGHAYGSKKLSGDCKLGAVDSLIGSMQAVMAIKTILGRMEESKIIDIDLTTGCMETDPL